jgi:hypothetical protein
VTHPARDRKRVAPLSLPVRRVSISGDPPGTQTVLFSGNPPTTQSVLFSGDPPTTCSPATQTVIRVFWVFFFFILFGYVGEKESCFGVWFSQGVISGDPLVFGFLRYRPKPRSFGFVFFFSVFIWSLGFCNLLLGVH